MRFVPTILALFAVSLSAPAVRAQDDARTRRILDRIERELADSRKRLREEIRSIIRTEVEKTARSTRKKPVPPKSKPALASQLNSFADTLKNDGALNSRLKRFLKTPKGLAFIRQQLEESDEFATFDDAVRHYCVKGGDGRYSIREEHEEAVREMLDQMTPVPAAPKPAPPAKKVRLGIVADDFDPGERKKLGIRGGIKIVEARGPAKIAGVQAGDVLLEIDGTPVTEETILRTLGKYRPGRVVKVTLLRGGKRLKLDLKLGER